MRTFGITLATVLCAIQLTAAIPRPDFGISLDVFAADRTAAVADSVADLIGEVYDATAITLTAGYVTLQDVLDEAVAIEEAFAPDVLALFDAIEVLADATSSVGSSFQVVLEAISDLKLTISGFSSQQDAINSELPDNAINIQLDDAFGEVLGRLDELEEALNDLKPKIDAAVTEAGSEDSVTQLIFRQKVKPVDTAAVTQAVLRLKADLPLVFYVLATTKRFLKLADEYILDAGEVAASAVDTINAGLEVLADEVQSYSDNTDQLKTIVTDVATPNLDFDSLDLTVIPAIQTETVNLATLYTTTLDETEATVKGHFDDYKVDIGEASEGYAGFFAEDACDHIYALVTVLINNGPYAEYCYNKYADEALSFFDLNASKVNQCVDKEITRLFKLQETLLSLAKLLVFSIEDLLDTVTLCVEFSAQCNDSDIDQYLNAIFSSLDEALVPAIASLVDLETDAGLARLQACIAASKYELLADIAAQEQLIATCEADGPNESL